MSLRDGADATQKERAVIDRQVRHLVRLVDDLLDVSRIARGKIELSRGHFELSSIVAQAVEMASPLLEERRHNLHLRIPRTGLIVNGDATRLSQVVQNLLTNAAKYTEPGGRIDVEASRHGKTIELHVRDNGIGISAEMLPTVFDLFVQSRQAVDRSQGGLGLGLTIVRTMVELHGGSVEARSDGVGRGSAFVIRLPAAQASAPPKVHRRSPRRVTRGPAIRALIVDDNIDAAAMLADGLKTFGYEVRTAADGPAAIALAGQFQPHVALLDLGLPVMDGYEVSERLRDVQHADCDGGRHRLRPGGRPLTIGGGRLRRALRQAGRPRRAEDRAGWSGDPRLRGSYVGSRHVALRLSNRPAVVMHASYRVNHRRSGDDSHVTDDRVHLSLVSLHDRRGRTMPAG
jgi:two-component sensor histidine kinase